MTDSQDQLLAELVQGVRRLLRQSVRYYDAVADQLGLTLTDLTCVDTLRERRRATASELAAELGLTTGAVTRMIDRLVQAGFVARRPDPADRRRVIVTLEPTAEASVAGLFAGQAAHLTEAGSTLTAGQLQLLRDFVRERAEATQREADRLRQQGRPHAVRRGGPPGHRS
ncbi:MarR family winged helix-turn-helix transcriptional regulator [Natronosporangium hydrolyticum]|uniref:MarR family winged helix-turn-helix transcriptional regulator n=1 Tax=Natronosporangium hydrolyticum TaxID=2811111 RepID=UPI001EFA1193|nr:MarR family transcriptional regulator [Natronosporangium hydrolyticum]